MPMLSSGNRMSTRPLSYIRFAGYAAIAVAAALVPVLVWLLTDTLIMAFGAVLLAALLHLASEPLQRWTPLPLWASLLIAAAAIIAIVALAGWVFGSHISAELADVVGQAQRGAEQLRQSVGSGPLGGMFLSSLNNGISVSGLLASMMAMSLRATEAIIVIVISAAYVAADPKTYAEGALKLVPHRWRPWARELLEDVAHALRYWLLGQLIEMTIVALLTIIAAFLIPLPSPLALGLIAGVTEFIPYVGPILAAIPALLIALTKDVHVVIWTAVAYLAIHQAEGNFVAPLIQRRMTFVPPALMLIGIAAFWSLAGLYGLIFAAPMVVCVYVLVQKIYLRDVLNEPTTLAGEHTDPES